MTKQHPQGFTLTELIVYIGILSIVVLLVTTFFLNIIRHAGRAQMVQVIQHTTRVLADRLAYDIRGALTVDTGTSLFGTDHGALALSGVGGAMSRYAWENNVVTVANGGSPAPLTSDAVRVTQLRFTQVNNGIDVQIRVEQKDPTAQPAAAYDSTFHSFFIPRNELY